MSSSSGSPVVLPVRWLVTAALVATALVLQVSVFTHVGWHGSVPNLCLLVVVAAALTWGPDRAAALGFAAGLLMDLTPPADHLAGRWALSLVVVGYVAGKVRADPSSGSVGPKPSATAVLAIVAASSFVGTSLFAITGLLLRDPVVPVGDLLPVVLTGVVLDVLLAPLVLPGLMRLLTSLEPSRATA